MHKKAAHISVRTLEESSILVYKLLRESARESIVEVHNFFLFVFQFFWLGLVMKIEELMVKNVITLQRELKEIVW